MSDKGGPEYASLWPVATPSGVEQHSEENQTSACAFALLVHVIDTSDSNACL